MQIPLTLPILHPGQKQILAESSRFNVCCLGRRTGKTFLGSDLLIDGPSEKGALHGYPVAWFAPNYKYLLEVWRRLMPMLAPITKAKSEQDKRIGLITGGSIEFWSLDDTDSGRGRKYATVVIDEAAMVKRLEDAVEQTVRPMLMDYRGDLWLLSTPKGLSGPGAAFKSFFDRGKVQNRDKFPDWRSWQMPTSANPHIDPSEIEAARQSLPDLVFQQEILAQFVDFGGTMVKREWLRHGNPPAGMDLFMGVDLAISTKDGADYTAVVVCGVDADGHVWIVHADRRRATFHDALSFIRKTAETYNPKGIAVESVQYQAAAVHELLRKTDLPVISVRPDKDKLTRFQRLQVRYQQGLVWHSSVLPDFFEDELLSFPVGEHDDLIDAAVYAYNLTGDYGRSQIILPDAPQTVNANNSAYDPQKLLIPASPHYASETCGACSAFADGRCRERSFTVSPNDIACQMFS